MRRTSELGSLAWCAVILATLPAFELTGRVVNVWAQVGDPIRVNDTPSENDVEVSIAVNRSNPQNQVIFGHGDPNPAPNTTLPSFWTDDGGLTWNSRLIGYPDDLLGQGDDRTDPSLAFAQGDTVYFVYGEKSFSLVCARSVDGGRTCDQYAMVATGSLDKWIVATGPTSNPSDPYNVYVAATVGGGSTVRVKLFRSSDGGSTFPPEYGVQVSDDDGNGFWPVPAVGPGGEVYVVYHDFENSVIELNYALDENLRFQASPHVVGPSLARARTPIPAQQHRGIYSLGGIAVDRSNGPHRGRVYVVWQRPGTGSTFDVDVVLRYTDDITDPASWSAEIEVPEPSDMSQFHGWVDVDPITGMVAVIWYDARDDDPSNVLVKPRAAFSFDGGDTWTREDLTQQQSDGSSTADGFREYIGVNAHDGVVYGVWCDNSSGGPGGKCDYYWNRIEATAMAADRSSLGRLKALFSTED